MVAILEHPGIRRLVSPMSVETYHQLAEIGPDVQPCELIRGIVVDKADKMSRSQLHIGLVRRIARMLLSAAQAASAFVAKEDLLTLTDSEPEPDVAVIPGREEDYDLVRVTTALLVVEVSVTSLELDRLKADLYAEANIPEYWIVRANDNAVDVCTIPVGGLYTQQRTYQVGEVLTTYILPALRVDLAALFGS